MKKAYHCKRCWLATCMGQGPAVWVALLGLPTVVAAVTLTTNRGLTYCAISLAGILVAVLVSLSMRQARYVQYAVVAGFIIRVLVLALLILDAWSTTGEAYYLRGGDAANYHTWAQVIISTGQVGLGGTAIPFSHVVAGIYRIFGPDPNIVDLLNLCVSLLLIPLVAELGTRCGGRQAGVISGWLVCLHPSLVLWSISGVKDVWIVLGAVLVAFMITSMAAGKHRLSDSLKLAVGALLLVWLRYQLVLSLVLALGATAVSCSRGYMRRGSKLFLTLAVVIAVVLTIMSPVGQRAVNLVGRSLQEDSWEGAQATALSGGSGIALLSRVPARARWIAQLPYVLLAPFPWQWMTVGSGINRLVSLEMALWYLFIAGMLARKRVWMDNSVSKSLIIWALSIALAVSFSLPNLGSIHRYRVSATVVVIPLMSQVLVASRKRV